MRYLAENPNITSYVAIEPNKSMHAYLYDKAKELHLNFPIEVRALKVFITHVLCSVDDPSAVLGEIARVLKHGGRFFFLEHVASPKDTLRRRLQDAISPLWTFLFDGCRFDETDCTMDKLKTSASEFKDVTYEHVELPMLLPILKPHIIGMATRK